MTPADKRDAILALERTFKEARLVVVTRPQGLSVAEVSDLRRRMRSAGASFKVMKNRLAKRALENSAMKDLAGYFSGPTAIGWSDDLLAPAKVAVEFAKENDKLEVLVGATQERILSKETLLELASLPPLEVVRAQLLRLLQTPAQRLVGTLGESGAQLARVVKARSEQEQGHEQGHEAES